MYTINISPLPLPNLLFYLTMGIEIGTGIGVAIKIEIIFDRKK